MNNELVFHPLPADIRKRFRHILDIHSCCLGCDRVYPRWKLARGLCPMCRGAAADWDRVFYYGTVEQRIAFLERIDSLREEFIRDRREEIRSGLLRTVVSVKLQAERAKREAGIR